MGNSTTNKSSARATQATSERRDKGKKKYLEVHEAKEYE